MPVQKIRTELETVTNFVDSPCTSMRKGIQLRKTSGFLPDTQNQGLLHRRPRHSAAAEAGKLISALQDAVKTLVFCSCNTEFLPDCSAS